MKLVLAKVKDAHWQDWYIYGERQAVYTKFAGHAGQVRQKSKMSGEGLLLNSIKCPAKRSKCPAKLQKTSCTLDKVLQAGDPLIPKSDKELDIGML